MNEQVPSKKLVAVDGELKPSDIDAPRLVLIRKLNSRGQPVGDFAYVAYWATDGNPAQQDQHAELIAEAVNGWQPLHDEIERLRSLHDAYVVAAAKHAQELERQRDDARIVSDRWAAEAQRLRASHEPPAAQVAGDMLPTTLYQFELRVSRLLDDEQSKASPCNALIGVLCDAVRLARENERMAKSGLTQPPGVGPLKLDTDRQVFFYEQDHYYLSNFSAFQVRLVVPDHDFGGKRCIDFDTSEIAYHWFKFEADGREYEGDHHVRGLILSARSSHEAFKIAEKWRDHRRPDWDDVKVGIMRDILWAKVGQHEYVYRKLLETGDRELIENSWRDDFWGWGENRDGQNMLGKLWMQIRTELRASTLTKEVKP